MPPRRGRGRAGAAAREQRRENSPAPANDNKRGRGSCQDAPSEAEQTPCPPAEKKPAAEDEQCTVVQEPANANKRGRGSSQAAPSEAVQTPCPPAEKKPAAEDEQCTVVQEQVIATSPLALPSAPSSSKRWPKSSLSGFMKKGMDPVLLGGAEPPGNLSSPQEPIVFPPIVYWEGDVHDARPVDDGSRFHDGTLLPALACCCFNSLSPEDRSAFDACKGHIPTMLPAASACSGSAMDTFVDVAVAYALRHALGVAFELPHTFECELVPMKRDWILKVTGFIEQGPCLFRDVACLSSDAACCDRHMDPKDKDGSECPIMPPKFFRAGFSCKDFSRLNFRAKQRGIDLSDLDDEGSSTQTLLGILRFLDEHGTEVDVVVLENVDSMEDDSEQKHIADVIEYLEERSFHAQCVQLNSADYAGGARRLRIYIVAIRLHAQHWTIAEPDEWFRGLRSRLTAWRQRQLDINAIMLPDDDPIVREDHANRVSRIAKGEVTFYNDVGWPDKHMAFYRIKNLRWGALPCAPSSTSSPFFKGVPKREREVLAAFQRIYHAKISGDLGQSIDRAPYVCTESGVLTVGTIIPNGHIWIGNREVAAQPSHDDCLRQPRFLTGVEALMCQGFPALQAVKACPKASQSFMHDLAGNAYSGQVMVILSMAILLGLPWGDNPSRHDARAALDMLRASSMSFGPESDGSQSESDES
jgi:site-specific DNA-cytosine methylase